MGANLFNTRQFREVREMLHSACGQLSTTHSTVNINVYITWVRGVCPPLIAHRLASQHTSTSSCTKSITRFPPLLCTINHQGFVCEYPSSLPHEEAIEWSSPQFRLLVNNYKLSKTAMPRFFFFNLHIIASLLQIQCQS